MGICSSKVEFNDGIYYGDTSYINGFYQKNGKGKMIYFNGDIYEGEWLNDKKNGKGILFFFDLSTYDGSFKDDIINGYGTYKTIQNETYSGMWENGFKHGKGRITYSDGDSYDGMWVNNNRHGKGRYEKKNGEMYVGDWKNNEKDGNGKYLTSNGNRYDGIWKNNIFWDGFIGELKFKNGDVFSGNFSNGKKNGKGKIIYQDGSIYEGGWMDDRKHGNGIFILTNGNKIEGTWKNDVLINSKLINQNGDLFEGDLNFYQKEGIGKITFNNGDKYEGNVVNGIINGKGRMIYANGYTYDGIWIDGKKNGRFQVYKNNEIIFNGIYNGDICIAGVGTYIDHANNITFVGEIKNYQYVGQGELKMHNNNTTLIGNFVNGNLEGWGIIENDNERYEGQIYNGLKHGFGNQIIRGKTRKGIWKNNQHIHKYYEYYRDEQTCDICFGDYSPLELFPACADNTCVKVFCLDCMTSYYSKMKSGCYMSESNFLCMYCRKIENFTVLEYHMENLFNLINKYGRDKFFREIKNNKIGWCKKCNALEIVPKADCAMGENNSDFLCIDCGIGNAVKTKACPHCGFKATRSDSYRDGCHHICCPQCKKYWCWFCFAKLQKEHRWRCAVNNCDNPDR
jgi:hypothetical protein